MTSTLEFAFTDKQQQLREQAREVAHKGVEKHGRFNDSWINGFSKEFAETMAENGWIGMGWPKEHGGQERPPIERVIVAEEMIAAGAPIAAMWFADKWDQQL
jgi:alkylation response protein AidB-like acyl-CoA dehydrogenase